MPAQTAANATTFRSVLAAMAAKVTGRVRVIAAPNDRLHEYLAQEGVLLRVRAPEPTTLSGAGRHGFLVQRVVDVVILTQSLRDAPGRDENAVYAHLDKEEAVLDALVQNVAAPIQVHWVPGGEDIARQIKSDTGMLISVLSLKVVYQAPFTVTRA